MHIKEKNIHEIFVISLIIKGINSTLQIIGGTALLFTNKVNAFLSYLIDSEMLENPDDIFSKSIEHILVYISNHSHLYVSVYLLSHGIIKLILVISLLRNKLWAYPATVATVIVFIIYQLYRLTFGYSLFLILLTIFDVFVIWLTLHEYKITKIHIENRVKRETEKILNSVTKGLAP
jgi:uncharacterized membrane protein